MLSGLKGLWFHFYKKDKVINGSTLIKKKSFVIFQKTFYATFLWPFLSPATIFLNVLSWDSWTEMKNIMHSEEADISCLFVWSVSLAPKTLPVPFYLFLSVFLKKNLRLWNNPDDITMTSRGLIPQTCLVSWIELPVTCTLTVMVKVETQLWGTLLHCKWCRGSRAVCDLDVWLQACSAAWLHV